MFLNKSRGVGDKEMEKNTFPLFLIGQALSVDTVERAFKR